MIPVYEFTAYDWLCLEFARERVTMPARLVHNSMVEPVTIKNERGEYTLGWDLTENGCRIILQKKRGEFDDDKAPESKPQVFGASWGHSSGPKSDEW